MAEYVYKWDIETIATEETDEYYVGDIIDHDHMDEPRLPVGEGESLVLVCDAYYLDGYSTRAWAYVENRKLPEYFLDLRDAKKTKVPQKFHNQLARLLK